MCKYIQRKRVKFGKLYVRPDDSGGPCNGLEISKSRGTCNGRERRKDSISLTT